MFYCWNPLPVRAIRDLVFGSTKGWAAIQSFSTTRCRITETTPTEPSACRQTTMILGPSGDAPATIRGILDLRASTMLCHGKLAPAHVFAQIPGDPTASRPD